MKKFILFSLAIALGGSNTLFAAQGVAGKILRKRSRIETIANNISSKYACIDEVIPADHVCIEYYGAKNTPVIEYHLPVKVAKLSRFFKETLDVQEEAQEEELQIVIPNVMSHTTLEFVIDLMNIYNQIEERNPESSDHGKIRFLYTSLEAQSLSEETLEELLEALYFLGVPPLINTIHLLFHASSHNFSGSISSRRISRIIPHIKKRLQHAADKFYDEIKPTELVDLSVIPESFKDINDLKSYLNHPIAQSFRHHSNEVMAKFVRDCMTNEQMVSFVRDYIAQALTANSLPEMPELIKTFQAQPLTPLYIALFIEYHLQTNAEGRIASLTLSRVANKIRSFRANHNVDAMLDFSDIDIDNEFSRILGPLCQIIEPLCQRPLTSLDLSNNQLTSIPAALGNLTHLTKIILWRNQLTEIPEALGNLTNLTHLYLWNNQLTEVPATLGNLINLRYLNLSFNQLTDIPAWVGNLTNLTELGLSFNQLTEIPAELGNLINLTNLWLYHNQLTEIPASLNRRVFDLMKDDHVVFAAE
jgi:Leucine-rich repeat (LRR) protein